MRQPQIFIKDKFGKEYGYYNVVSLFWSKGILSLIEVDWYKDNTSLMRMYFNNKVFENIHRNLIGKLITEEDLPTVKI